MKNITDMTCVEAAFEAIALLESGQLGLASKYVEESRSKAQWALNMDPHGDTAKTVRRMNKLCNQMVDRNSR